MVGNLIRLVVIVALVSLVINIFPGLYSYLKEFIHWILDFGKWGIIILFSIFLMALFDFFR
jgi:hypothetical protein